MGTDNSTHNFVLITQYYPPEIGGGSQRSVGFAEELSKCGLKVIIVTPFPSYLIQKDKFKTKFRLYERYSENDIIIYRTFVYASDRGNFIKRMFYYLSFMFSASLVALLKIKKIDYVLTISPPLFTGVVGIILKYFKSAPFIFDIGDLWPESAIHLGFLKNKFAIKLAEKLERTIYKRSDSINVVTQGTIQKLRSTHSYLKKISLIPNFVDTEKIKKSEKDTQLLDEFGLKSKMVFGYAGNIGGAQGLKIITDTAKLTIDNTQIIYFIVGEGVDRELIQNEILKNKLNNVILTPPVSREKIPKYISLFDGVIIPLVSNGLFKMTIPSKLYETMAAELPSLLCVDGEARKIIEKYNCGLFVEPENSVMLAEKVNYLYANRKTATQLGLNGREGAVREFDRRVVIRNFYNTLLNEKNH